mmetsp:Transcript_182/g.436  ORF Transcript_182/g.436 Transcript_182/m.436 type:complete len:430 (-) Transcript_182:101-1390(-)
MGQKRTAWEAALDWVPSWARCARRLGEKSAGQRKVLLVVGECGDGKSTLINWLRDPLFSTEAASGLHGRGITKEIMAYVGKPVDGVPIDYLDTPGVGDTDVTPMRVLTMIEQELISDELGGQNAIDGVIVTTPIPDGRVKLGAQVVQLLVEHGFLGEDKWSNIILVGTKADRATKEELELFHTDRKDTEGHAIGIAAQFFSSAPGGKGVSVVTAKNHYADLQKAIAALPNLKVKYSTPDPEFMAEKFSAKLGVSKDVFQKELLEARKELEKQMAAQLEEQARLKKQLEELRKKQLEAEEQQKLEIETKELHWQSQELQHERVVAELQMAGPAERAKLEATAARLKRDLQSQQDEHRQQQQAWSSQLKNYTSEIQALTQQLQSEKEKCRNYAFKKSSADANCLHLQRRNWGNAYGRGCKCLRCGAELGRP